MCIGIPMQVVESGEFHARCLGGGREETVDLTLVGPQKPGTWLLVFLGDAREVLDSRTAAQITSALAALHSVLNGNSDVDRFFPDLVLKEHAA
jgi:hydrogenase expression/formation protein HypC